MQSLSTKAVLKDNDLFIHDDEIDKAAERYKMYTEHRKGDQTADEVKQLLDRREATWGFFG